MRCRKPAMSCKRQVFLGKIAFSQGKARFLWFLTRCTACQKENSSHRWAQMKHRLLLRGDGELFATTDSHRFDRARAVAVLKSRASVALKVLRNLAAGGNHFGLINSTSAFLIAISRCSIVVNGLKKIICFDLHNDQATQSQRRTSTFVPSAGLSASGHAN